MEEQKKTPYTCLVCGHDKYTLEEGGLDSKWGASQHRTELVICKQCGYIMLFSKGRSWFLYNPD